ncbi:MAG: hemerythrin domain-containing protein [Rhizobiaceae bacterium]|nr:hemerythrin domain-containing protein [Rhizobiaceae bacterium]
MNAQALTLEDKIRGHHKSQLELCERLEKIADDLPDKYDRQECLSIAWQLYPAVRSAHRFEEQELFPLLVPTAASEEEISKSIERLKFEHWEDESSAEDISLYLRQLIRHPESANIGKISYMLRGFFEGLRRHIAFETEHLLPKLREIQ